MVLFQLLSFRRPRRPTDAEFSDLPPFAEDESAQRRDYRLLAGGLALVLSRCSPRAVERDFPNSALAFRLLRRQLAAPLARVGLSAHTLNELAHEIAMCADEVTRAAALRCLQRAITH